MAACRGLVAHSYAKPCKAAFWSWTKIASYLSWATPVNPSA